VNTVLTGISGMIARCATKNLQSYSTNTTQLKAYLFHICLLTNINHRPAVLWRFYDSGARYKIPDLLNTSVVLEQPRKIEQKTNVMNVKD